LLHPRRLLLVCCFMILDIRFCVVFFFFSAPAYTEFYTLSLHDALPILLESFGLSRLVSDITFLAPPHFEVSGTAKLADGLPARLDRKSTRLNSSHVSISYAVFCLKKKKKTDDQQLSVNQKK